LLTQLDQLPTTFPFAALRIFDQGLALILSTKKYNPTAQVLPGLRILFVQAATDMVVFYIIILLAPMI
jgi:hypothetical protein